MQDIQNERLLIVDDDRRLRDLLEKYLRENGFMIVAASCAAEARAHLATGDVDLIVLDVMMPGEDGFQLTKSLRAQQVTTPILFLTAKDTLDDRIDGLDIGGDDYMNKPFEPGELLARIRAILRRSRPIAASTDNQILLHFGELTFNLAQGKLEEGGEAIFLSSTELVLLKTLAQAPRQPFSRSDLAQRIGHKVSERSVDVQITRLRRKINDDPRQPKYIQTVRHVGYVLCPDEGATG